jgi:diadenylate cyclase
VGRDGIFLSACRYLDGVAAQVRVPLGLGGRHLAAANMSAVTKAVGIVVSEGLVVRLFCRLFCHGQLVGEIIPGFWMMDHAHRRGSVKREQVGEFMNGAHTKSATGLGREVRINFEYPERTHDSATGIQM